MRAKIGVPYLRSASKSLYSRFCTPNLGVERARRAISINGIARRFLGIDERTRIVDAAVSDKFIKLFSVPAVKFQLLCEPLRRAIRDGDEVDIEKLYELLVDVSCLGSGEEAILADDGIDIPVLQPAQTGDDHAD